MYLVVALVRRVRLERAHEELVLRRAADVREVARHALVAARLRVGVGLVPRHRGPVAADHLLVQCTDNCSGHGEGRVSRATMAR